MKINESVAPVVSGSTTRTAQSAEQKVVKDKVSVSSPEAQAAVDGAQASINASRSARVAEIINAVQSGQYYPSPQQIAQKLVSEAELEARMRAILAT